MSQPDELPWCARDLQRAAAAADAAALQFRQAAESLQAGHVVLSAAENRLALDLLRPWLPDPLVAAVLPPPMPTSRWTRGVESLRLLGDCLKILPLCVLMLGCMAYLALIRVLPGFRPSKLWPPEYDPAHWQPLPPGLGYRPSGALPQDLAGSTGQGVGGDTALPERPVARPHALMADALQHAMRPAGTAVHDMAEPAPRAGRAPSGARAADE